MKTLIAVVLLLGIIFPVGVYAGSTCEVVDYSLYTDVKGNVHNGDGHIYTVECARIEVKNTCGGSRFGGEITVTFSDYQTETYPFSVPKQHIGSGVYQYTKRIENGEIYTVKACWGRD